MKEEIHEIARKKGWKLGVDYPNWGNNGLYLTTINGGYLLENETPKDAYTRISSYAAKLLNKPELEEKFFEIFWNGWLIPSTPVMANFGTDLALPISCFSSYVGDSMYEIYRKNTEMAMLSKYGGGTAYDFSGIRGIGTPIKDGRGGTSDGIIPFIKSFDSTILASKQSKVRRGAVAIYLNAEHKEYSDFIEVRESKGDVNRQCHNIHQGGIFTNEFMNKVVEKNGKERELWLETIKKRVKTGEPYCMFIDNANNVTPEWWKNNDLKIRHSNLCVAPETQILTSSGYYPISELENEEIEVWNGKEYSNVVVKKTGENQKLLNVEFSNGQSMYVTEYHKFYIQKGYDRGTGKNRLIIEEKKASELNVGDKIIKFKTPIIDFEEEYVDAYTQGFFTGDGCSYKGNNHIDLYGTKIKLKEFIKHESIGSYNESQDRVRIKIDSGYRKFEVPTRYSIKSRIDWFEGLCDSDGVLCKNGDTQHIQVSSINKEFLLETHLMLQTLGIQSKVTKMADECVRSMPDGKGGKKDFMCQTSYRLLIGSDALNDLKMLGFSPKRLILNDHIPNRNCEQFIKVTSINFDGRYDDTYCVNEPKEHKVIFNGIITGNCNEIYLPTDEKHTLVCCLSSLNLVKFDEWKDTQTVFYSIMFLDAVMQDFIDKGEGGQYLGIEDPVRFAKKSRALGLGALGWHSYLQSKMIPFISVEANAHTSIIFKHIKDESEKATLFLGNEYGEPEWCKGTGRRNLTLLAIAPNRSSSKLAGGLSQGVEPIAANLYMDDDAKGLHIRRNQFLEKLLEERGKNIPQVWDAISEDKGSVRNVRCLTNDEKNVFKTFKEINQLELVRQAGIRQKYIDQGQSINLAFFQDAPAKFINQVHLEAWKLGLKGLYYLRSESVLRADTKEQRDLYSECLMCEG